MNRKLLVIVSVGALVLILAAGAFTAVQLLAGQSPETEPPPGAMVFEDVMDDGSGSPVTVRTIVLPAVELPQEPPAVSGVLTKEEDNSYFVGTGSVSVSISAENGETTTAVDHSGPEIEAVTGRDTLFYRDLTEIAVASTESKEVTLQQEVIAVERPPALPEGANIQVWGEKRGDRVVADIIVYAEPQ